MARRRLRPDEVELWRRVTALVSPREPAPRPEPETPSPSIEPAAPPVRRPALPARRAGPVSATRAAASVPAPPRIDGHLRRDLVRGKRRPEARIDLHDMTLAQAHSALTHFVLSSHSAGRRVVLVITGKGRAGREPHGWDGGRGVLRRQVPVWLSGPPLAPLVIDVTQAHRLHGGEGALYVVLRRG
jgi:DNA-nicking Smr family endonuclease